MKPLSLVNLTKLMECTTGRPEVTIGLIDGPVAVDHPQLTGGRIQMMRSRTCADVTSAACAHGTFVAGILSARRISAAPAICPSCTLLVSPVFVETSSGALQIPDTTARALSSAIIECVNAGARCINMSLAVTQPWGRDDREIGQALDYAVQRGVIVVAAAGNRGVLGSTAITRHPGVIPVVACDPRGQPTNDSNLGFSIGRRGLCAPGEAITSLGAGVREVTMSGTSAAAPFVTGAIALLWSMFPRATAAHVTQAISRATAVRGRSVSPPLLDAWSAYQTLAALVAG